VPARNALLLAASLLFYAWGEALYVVMLLVSIGFNTVCGYWIDRWRGRRAAGRLVVLAVAANLLLLGAFKYANFAADSFAPLLVALGFAPIELTPIHLPIGISFFTFQALTYIVDVHRRDAAVAPSPLHVAVYISLFPQLIAGPIVRYRQVAEELVSRTVSREAIAAGIRRFIVGLGKKVLIANTLAVPADRVFDAAPANLGLAAAWIGTLCFSLQIYFDFSGYSDMAIGLGRILGFHFPENFDHPYTSRSVREFWRRWHISLSSWFRDYLYIPLGGSRGSALRTYTNLFTVFLLCGLWHGASWSFVVWGLLHGTFLSLERTGLEDWLRTLWAPIGHVYTLMVVMLAWVFFRADTLTHALTFLKALGGGGAFGPGQAVLPQELLQTDVVVALLAAALGSTPWMPARYRQVSGDSGTIPLIARPLPPGSAAVRLIFVSAVLAGCAMSLAAGTHNPFIYFRF
jgi:alginate O-acetyltransferase complex protein AlgI